MITIFELVNLLEIPSIRSKSNTLLIEPIYPIIGSLIFFNFENKYYY